MLYWRLLLWVMQNKSKLSFVTPVQIVCKNTLLGLFLITFPCTNFCIIFNSVCTIFACLYWIHFCECWPDLWAFTATPTRFTIFSCCLILTLIKPLNQNNTWLTLCSTLFYLNKLPSRNEYLSVHWPWQQMRSAWCYNVPDNSDTFKHGLTSVLEMITSCSK